MTNTFEVISVKKILSCLMAVVILAMFICSFPVSAANPTIAVGTSSYKVSPGDVVTVSVTLSSGSGLGTLDFNLNYNTSYFEYVSGSASATSLFDMAVVNDGVAGTIKYVGAATDTVTAGGTLMSMKFKVLKTDGTISLSVTEATDANDNNVSVSKTSVKFSCAHNNMKWTVEKKATCESVGSEKGTCSTCGYTTTREIAATGEHKFGNPVVVKKATCTTEGIERGTCSVCGETTENKIKKTGHNYTDWVVTKQPTLITKGEKERTCLTCGDKQTQVIASTEVEKPTTPSTDPSTEPTSSLFPTEEPSTEEELIITTQPTQNYYEIETEPQTEPSGGLFGAGLEDGDGAVLLVIVLAVVVVIVLAVYILLIAQRRKK